MKPPRLTPLKGRPPTVFVSYGGRRTPLARVAKVHRMSYPLLYKRHIVMGWTLSTAISTRVLKRKAPRP